MDNRHLRASAAAFVLILACASTSSEAGAQSGSDITPPAGATVVREVQAGGAQVYACRAGANGAYAWTLTGPQAVLINDEGGQFGTHSAGPTWTATDGSSISADGAHPMMKVDRPGAVPALLLNVKSSKGTGVLNGVRYVRRADTEGGLPPAAGCDASHVNATTATHYSAVYTFYR
jgi:hypothetical protein